MSRLVDVVQAADFLEKAVLDSLDQPIGEAKLRQMEEHVIGRGGEQSVPRGETFAPFDLVTDNGQVFRVRVSEVRR